MNSARLNNSGQLLDDLITAIWNSFTKGRNKSLVCKLITKQLVTLVPQKKPVYSLIPVSSKIKTTQSRDQSMPPEWSGHRIAERVIVYHEADKAGPHVEAYIIIDGKGYNIGVKRLRPEHIKPIRKNSQGFLTQESQKHLINILRKEYENGAWLAQTTDHSPDEARMSWTNREHNDGYGAGQMRQVISDEKIDLFKSGSSIEWRDYTINPHANAYVFGLMEPKEGIRNARMLKLGIKSHSKFIPQDRLHLKPHIGEHNLDHFLKAIGQDGVITLKEDGASFYFQSNSKGTNFYSPRISKQTKERISYNNKVRDLINIKSSEPVTGMGELNYIDRRTGRVLTSAETGGVLNKDAPIADYLQPKLTIYRIDTKGRSKIFDLPYRDNLVYIDSFVSQAGRKELTKPTIVAPSEAKEVALHNEGLVGIPNGHSIMDGHKFKPRGDFYDWTVTDVKLKPGPKGRIAGTVQFTNREGKAFDIGASSMGNDTDVLDVMDRRTSYIGRVAKVECYKGHEGRAAKFVEWHDAKGIW